MAHLCGCVKIRHGKYTRSDDSRQAMFQQILTLWNVDKGLDVNSICKFA